MPLEVLLGQILQVALGEGDVSLNGHFFIIAVDLDGFSQVSGLAVDLNPLPEVFGEVGCVEDFILDWFGAVNDEGAGNLLLSALFLGLLLDLGSFLGYSLNWGLFCGHHKYIFLIIIN